MSESFRRITGTEMEYVFSVADKNNPPGRGRTLSSNEYTPFVNKYLKKEDVVFLKSASYNQSFHWLGNGARWYNDTGEHREYATPEDDSFIGTTANEMVGEALTAAVAQLIAEEEPDRFGPVEVSKRVIDDIGNVCGYHENYCVDAKSIAIDPESLALLGVHMATRNILFGTGYLKPNGSFLLAQKGSRATLDFDNGTTGARKPVVNLRDEPHCDSDINRRVHLISGDPNMSPWATRLKLGTTSLVLALIEHGRSLPSIRLKDPLAVVMNNVSLDLDGNNRYRLKNGRVKTAAEIQLSELRAAMRLAKEIDFDDEHLWSLQEWDKALHDFIQDPKLLRDRADWVIKREILECTRDRHGMDWKDAELRGVDRSFSNLGKTGIGLTLRKSRWEQWMPPQPLLKERRAGYPPPNTRAVLRGTFIEKFPESHATIDWSSITYKGHLYSTKLPAMINHAELQKLFDDQTDKQLTAAAHEEDSDNHLYPEFTD